MGNSCSGRTNVVVKDSQNVTDPVGLSIKLSSSENKLVQTKASLTEGNSLTALTEPKFKRKEAWVCQTTEENYLTENPLDKESITETPVISAENTVVEIYMTQENQSEDGTQSTRKALKVLSPDCEQENGLPNFVNSESRHITSSGESIKCTLGQNMMRDSNFYGPNPSVTLGTSNWHPPFDNNVLKKKVSSEENISCNSICAREASVDTKIAFINQKSFRNIKPDFQEKEIFIDAKTMKNGSKSGNDSNVVTNENETVEKSHQIKESLDKRLCVKSSQLACRIEPAGKVKASKRSSANDSNSKVTTIGGSVTSSTDSECSSLEGANDLETVMATENSSQLNVIMKLPETSPGGDEHACRSGASINPGDGQNFQDRIVNSNPTEGCLEYHHEVTSEEINNDMNHGENANNMSYNQQRTVLSQHRKDLEIFTKSRSLLAENVAKNENSVFNKDGTFNIFHSIRLSVLKNSHHVLSNAPTFLNDAPKLFQLAPSLLDGAPKLFKNAPNLLQNAPRVFQCIPNIMGNAPKSLKNAPRILTNAPKAFCDAPGKGNDRQNFETCGTRGQGKLMFGATGYHGSGNKDNTGEVCKILVSDNLTSDPESEEEESKKETSDLLDRMIVDVDKEEDQMNGAASEDKCDFTVTTSTDGVNDIGAKNYKRVSHCNEIQENLGDFVNVKENASKTCMREPNREYLVDDNSLLILNNSIPKEGKDTIGADSSRDTFTGNPYVGLPNLTLNPADQSETNHELNSISDKEVALGKEGVCMLQDEHLHYPDIHSNWKVQCNHTVNKSCLNSETKDCVMSNKLKSRLTTTQAVEDTIPTRSSEDISISNFSLLRDEAVDEVFSFNDLQRVNTDVRELHLKGVSLTKVIDSAHDGMAKKGVVLVQAGAGIDTDSKVGSEFSGTTQSKNATGQNDGDR